MRIQRERILKVERVMKVEGERSMRVEGERVLRVEGECVLRVEGERVMSVEGERIMRVEGQRGMRVELERVTSEQEERVLRVEREDVMGVKGKYIMRLYRERGMRPKRGFQNEEGFRRHLQVIGSRNPRNTVKALIGGFESQKTLPEVVVHLKKLYGERLIIRELAPGHGYREEDRIPGLAGRWFLSRDSRKRLQKLQGPRQSQSTT
eukprot:jgi/Botrbrau1/14237/Bobra.0381s0001.1